MSRLEVPGTPKEDSRFNTMLSDREVEEFIEKDKQKEKEAMKKASRSPFFNGVSFFLMAVFVFLYFFGKEFFSEYSESYSWALAMAFLVLAVYSMRLFILRENGRMAYHLEGYKSRKILKYIEENGLSLIEAPLKLPHLSTSRFHHFFRGETQGFPFVGFTNIVWSQYPYEILCMAFKSKVSLSDFKIFKSDGGFYMKNTDHFFLKTIDLNIKKISDLKGSYKAKLDGQFQFSKLHWFMFSHQDWLIIQVQGIDWFEETDYEDYKNFIKDSGEFAKSFLNV
jgi:hypothetical protein